MKKFLLWLPAMAIFASCANQDLTKVTEQSQTAVVTAVKMPLQDGGVLDDGSLLRTSVTIPDINNLGTNSISWNANDEIGIIALNTNNVFDGSYSSSNNYCFQYIVGSVTDPVSGGSFAKSNDGPMANLIAGNYIAYYPYRGIYMDQSGLDFTINLQSQIDGGSGTYSNYGTGDIMCGTNVIPIITTQDLNYYNTNFNKGNLKSSGSGAQITFKHQTATLFFKLDLSKVKAKYPTEKIYEIAIKSVNNNVLKRGFLMAPNSTMMADGYTPAMKLFTGGRVNGVPTPGAGADIPSDGIYKGVLKVAPVAAGEKLNILVITDNYYFNAGSFSAPAGGLKANYIYGIIPPTIDPDIPAYVQPKSAIPGSTALKVWDDNFYAVPWVYIKTKPNQTPAGDIVIRTPDEFVWLGKVLDGTVPCYDWGGLNKKYNDAPGSAFNACTAYLMNDIDLGTNPIIWAPFHTKVNTGNGLTLVMNGHQIYQNGQPFTNW